MHALTDHDLRASLINASRREATDLTPPPSLGTVDWRRLDYLGWRDPRLDRRAYAVVPGPDGGALGIVLTEASAAPRHRAMCSWCQDVRLPEDVVLYSARRAGAAGRKGDTVGSLVCRDFGCSRHVRNDPPPFHEGFDAERARTARIARLEERVLGFVRTVGALG